MPLSNIKPSMKFQPRWKNINRRHRLQKKKNRKTSSESPEPESKLTIVTRRPHLQQQFHGNVKDVRKLITIARFVVMSCQFRFSFQRTQLSSQRKMQNYPNKTKEMFIVKALEKILADKDIKRQGQLKKACESAITTLKGWFYQSESGFYWFSSVTAECV